MFIAPCIVVLLMPGCLGYGPTLSTKPRFMDPFNLNTMKRVDDMPLGIRLSRRSPRRIEIDIENLTKEKIKTDFCADVFGDRFEATLWCHLDVDAFANKKYIVEWDHPVSMVFVKLRFFRLGFSWSGRIRHEQSWTIW